MERKVYLARLKPERRQDYIDAHQRVNPRLLERYRAAGIARCSVHIRGEIIVLITESSDHAAALAALAADPLDLAWQELVGAMRDQEWQEMETIFCMPRDE